MSDTTGGSRRPTIYDVAERAGVSKSLVSLVLRDSPQVSQSRRAAVLAAIAELGYRPSPAATMLASGRTRTIEVLIDEYRNLSFVGLVEGMREALAEKNFHLTVTETRQPSSAGANPWSTSVDGRILAAEPTDAVLAGWGNAPLVVAGHRESIPENADIIASDDELGSQLACDHLFALGHRRIAHLGGSGGAARHRRLGYAAWIQQAGLPLLLAGEDAGTSEEDGYRGAIEILSRHPETTALTAANDLMASGAMAAVRERGNTVPGDISVVGFDNSPLAQSRYLSLTTIDDESVLVGARAAQALLSRIDEPGAISVRELIAPKLVVRGTTAAR